MNDSSVVVEHLDEATHVSSFEVVGQIDGQAHGCHGVLRRVCLVPNQDRKTQVLHPNTVDSDLPVVGQILRIDQSSLLFHSFRVVMKTRDESFPLH
jgi:hypothetical protein